ncbi:MAG: sulfatase-like hydrolase/transferase [Haloarculaceae archaeon]
MNARDSDGIDGEEPARTSGSGDRDARSRTSERRDVVLVTIDAWRRDAVADMSSLRGIAAAGDYEQSVAVSHSASTNGAFPPLLAGRHFMQAYDGDGRVAPDVTPLPEVLGERGYATAGIVASNPFLAKWAEYFDHFWNDGMTTDVDYSGPRYTLFDRASRFARLKQRVNATAVADRARRWYRSRDGPRFLWVHLMDVHAPYFTGIRGAREHGLLDTYATLFDYHVRGNDTPANRERLRALYDKCVEQLDERLADVFAFVDADAVVVVTGDHGEEFEHGFHGHAQLYDECVTTPFFARNLRHPVGECPVRHLDIGPSVLAELGVDPPPDWEGEPVDGTTRRALLSNHAPVLDRTYVGVRTEQYKFVKSYHDKQWTVEDRELYDHREDPGERTRVDDPAVASELEAAVDAFLDRDDADVGVIRERETGLDDGVENRLKELGYV